MRTARHAALRFVACSLGFAATLTACGDAPQENTDQGEENLAAETSIDPDTLETAEDAVSESTACAPPVAPFRELEVVDPTVLLNARAKNAVDGHWSFRWLAEQMAPAGVDPGDFVLRMLNTWKVNNVVNGFVLPARPGVQSIIDGWPKKNGKLDLSKAPFRLLSIVYRPDLATGCGAGEGRFVYALTSGPGDNLAAPAQSFTMIFEYHLPASAAVSAHTWATRWHKLSQALAGQTVPPPVNSETYRGLLQGITDLFARRGALPGAPNGNAISQIRTNEIAIASGADPEWQLREFHLAANGFLAPAATAQSPDPTHNNKGPLHDLILDNKAKINAGTFHIPPAFLGGRSDESTFGNQAWMAADPSTARHPEKIDAVTKRNFSMLTCNGCHHESQATLSGFYHVTPFSTFTGNGQQNVSAFVKADLGKRAAVTQKMLCSAAACAVPVSDGSGDDEPVRVH